MTDFQNQRTEHESKLHDLRRQRGIAFADGKAFDDAEIVAVENAIAALGDAEAVETMRARQAEAERLAALRKILKADLVEAEDERLQAVSRAETSCRELVKALGDILETSRGMQSICNRAHLELPMRLNENDTATRLGMLLSAVLKTIPRHPARLGHVQWQASFHKAEDDWTETERGMLAADLQRIIGKEI